MPINNYDGNTFVAFLDISGFKELMRDENEAWKALDRLYNTGYLVLRNQRRGSNEGRINGLFISDSGVLFVRRNNQNLMNTPEALKSILIAVRSINDRMLQENFMLTTSIAFGRFKYQERIEFEGIGKGLILSRCPERLYAPFMILLHTGMRIGELANLEWDDVDFERKVIKIRQKDGWSPKGKREREIPINEVLYELLLKMRKESERSSVVDKNGVKRYDRALWENFWRLAKKLGIQSANIHTFRHTFASYLIMSGVDLVTVKELLGHRDITTTMRYAHLRPGHKHWAVNRICSISRTDTIWSQSEKFVM